MKLNFGKRLLLLLHWLLSLAILASVVFETWVNENVFARLRDMLPEEAYMTYAGYAFLAVYLILSVVVLCIIFKRDKRSERGFITVDSSNSGKIRIAVSAVEQMVKQAVDAVEGIADMKIIIGSIDDAITITVNVSIDSGCHVPTLTLNMQRAIRQYVEMNCGVSVHNVSINVQTVMPSVEGARKLQFETKPVIPVNAPEAELVAPVVTSEEPVVLEESVAPEMPVFEEPTAEMPVVEELVEESTVVEAVEEVVEEASNSAEESAAVFEALLGEDAEESASEDVAE